MKWLIFLFLPLALAGCTIPQSGSRFDADTQRSQYELERDIDEEQMWYMDRHEEYGDIIQ
jgi:hypothetical protein